jgi:hypothetical protein
LAKAGGFFVNPGYLAAFDIVRTRTIGALDYVLVVMREPHYLAFATLWLRIPTSELVAYHEVWPTWATAA